MKFSMVETFKIIAFIEALQVIIKKLWVVCNKRESAGRSSDLYS
jgi:hypothetical protein